MSNEASERTRTDQATGEVCSYRAGLGSDLEFGQVEPELQASSQTQASRTGDGHVPLGGDRIEPMILSAAPVGPESWIDDLLVGGTYCLCY